MSQAILQERPYVNSNLFSGHYLDERLGDREEWECDDAAREAMAELQDLYGLEGPLVDNWIAKKRIDTRKFGFLPNRPTPWQTRQKSGGGSPFRSWKSKTYAGLSSPYWSRDAVRANE